MCENLQEISESSTEFPCVTAGICDPVAAGLLDTADIDCRGGAFFTCTPNQYCRRKRDGLKLKCELRPGIARWNGMKHLASRHTVALAEGLKSQAHCGEEGAGPYCIAKPTGLGLIAEGTGYFISLAVGGWKSIVAIETPGGADDRQWLTFWLILAALLFVERFFASIVLSTFPLYYEAKFVALVWLVWRSGAETCYRRIRRILERRSLLHSDNRLAEEQMRIMKLTGKGIVERHLTSWARRNASLRESGEDWEYDDETGDDATRQLFELSKFLISSAGAKQVEQSATLSDQDKALLIERAAAVVSFQPRYLRINILGAIDGPRGELPVMDRNGKADAYCVCRMVPNEGKSYPQRGVTSTTAYRCRRPQWNEDIEIPLRKGELDSDGFFRSHSMVASGALRLDVHDDEVGTWSLVWYFFRVAVIASAIIAVASYVAGIADDVSEAQQFAAFIVAALLLVGNIVSYIFAVLRRSDDEMIGSCTVPLAILMDHREHTLLLKLSPPDITEAKDGGENQKENKLRRGAPGNTNSVGGHGVIRIKLMLSEH